MTNTVSLHQLMIVQVKLVDCWNENYKLVWEEKFLLQYFYIEFSTHLIFFLVRARYRTCLFNEDLGLASYGSGSQLFWPKSPLMVLPHNISKDPPIL